MITTAGTKKRERRVLPVEGKEALTYKEIEALGYGSERMLRQLIATGVLKECVVRVGRSVRLRREVMIEELRIAAEKKPEQGGQRS